jgi:hypothetical protein
VIGTAPKPSARCEWLTLHAPPLTLSLLVRAANPRHDHRRRSKRHQAGTAPDNGGITVPGPWAGSVVDITPREGEEARAS